MIEDFDIIALNGITGDCLTTADDSTQLKLTPEQAGEIAQEHEDFLNRLESLAIVAIASGDWGEVYDHINFNAPEAEN
jgi:hypothetical protein